MYVLCWRLREFMGGTMFLERLVELVGYKYGKIDFTFPLRRMQKRVGRTPDPRHLYTSPIRYINALRENHYNP